jgi:hypothetical protein
MKPIHIYPTHYFSTSIIQLQQSLDDWLTMHHSITLVNFQLDSRILYLFIYNTFIKILYMFQAVRCSSSGGLIVSMQHMVSSFSVDDCHLQRVTIRDAA